ncbi:hypothetical protein EON65_42130 [archaeon]|nr:MAG: hypothetical protein EON65_42130 [archaeon]
MHYFQVRIPATLRKMKAARPGADVGRDVERGLKQLQQKVDAKVLKRMHKQTRDSVVCSIGF